MKRVKYILITILVYLCVSVSICYGESDNIHNFTIRPENFAAQTDWKIKNDASNYANSIPGKYIESTKRDTSVSAEFYVTESDYYTVWLLVLDSTDGYTQGYTQVSVDEIKDTQRFGSIYSNGFMWSKGNTSYHLDKGLHSITIHMGNVKSSVAAVFITNEDDLVLNENTEYESFIQPYEDITEPTFESDIIISENDSENGTYRIEFPTFLDDKAIAKCEYYMDDEIIDVNEDRVHVTNLLAPAKKYVYKAIVYDKLGHQAVIEKVLDLSTWSISTWELKNNNDFEIDNLSELGSSDTGIKMTLSFSTVLSGRPQARLFVGIYSKDGKRLVVSNISTVQASNGKSTKNISLSLPEGVISDASNYVIEVNLLDKITEMEPLIEGLIIGENEVLE